MAHVTFIDRSGKTTKVEVKEKEALKDAALRAGIDGIIGECGGAAMCGTCHCYADPSTAHLLPPKLSQEADTLEFVAINPKPASRLSCQIYFKNAMDGLILRVADL